MVTTSIADQQRTEDPRFSADDLLGQARALVPSLLRRASTAERSCRIPHETIQDLLDARLFGVAVPREYGGFEAGWELHSEIVATLAEGCASTAWVYSLFSQHARAVARMGKAAMDTVYGTGPQTLVSTSRGAGVRLAPTGGGWLATGRSLYSSGSDFARWIVVAGAQTSDGQTCGIVLRKEQVQMVDSWRPMGLRGTGSNDLTFEDAFVPTHLTSLAVGPDNPAVTSATYLGTGFGVPFGLSSVALGAGHALIERFIIRMKERSACGQAPTQAVLARIGASAAEIELARLLTRAQGRAITKTMKTNPAEAARLVFPTFQEAQVVQLVLSGVRRLFDVAGASALQEDEPMRRIYSDVIAAAHHVTLDWDEHCLKHGRSVAGIE